MATLLLLQSRKRITVAEVAAELEVSERTARRDLEALSTAGIPVYAQPGRGGGWSLVGGSRTDLSGLTAPEARTLFSVIGPAAISGAPAPELRAALRKLLRALPSPFASRPRRPAAQSWSTRAIGGRSRGRTVRPISKPCSRRHWKASRYASATRVEAVRAARAWSRPFARIDTILDTYRTGRKSAREAVTNAARLMTKSRDFQIKSAAASLLSRYGAATRNVDSKAFRFAGRGLVFLQAVADIAQYSAEHDDRLHMFLQTGGDLTGALLGGSAGTIVGETTRAVLSDGFLLAACGAAAVLIGGGIGGYTGSRIAGGLADQLELVVVPTKYNDPGAPVARPAPQAP